MSANCKFTISNEINNNEEETGGKAYTSRPGSDDYFHFPVSTPSCSMVYSVQPGMI
jgi:hypothetical protein